MKIIFCSDPFNSKTPDTSYEEEVMAIAVLGIDHVLIDHDALTIERNVAKATRQVKDQESLNLALYRGWMMRPNGYEKLYESLLAKGIKLLNDPAAYRHCHYLPESYSVIEGVTPKTVWLTWNDDAQLEDVMRLLEPFGSKPLVLKDFVKSQKHYWQEACFIPSASDRSAVERVVRRFLELQGESLAEGLVFREFVEFEPLAQHSKSGMPLTKEFRIFFLDSQPLYIANYWEEGNYGDERPPLDQFVNVARNMRSRFFTMDVAKRLNGDWLIVELGDAQVAGLLERADPVEFYKALSKHWPSP